MQKEWIKQIGKHIGKLRQTLAVKDFLVGEVYNLVNLGIVFLGAYIHFGFFLLKMFQGQTPVYTKLGLLT